MMTLPPPQLLPHSILFDKSPKYYYTSTKSWKSYKFITVCLCVCVLRLFKLILLQLCVCVCMCVCEYFFMCVYVCVIVFVHLSVYMCKLPYKQFDRFDAQCKVLFIGIYCRQTSINKQT